MGSKSDNFSEALLDLIFLNIPITLIGDAAGLLASAVDGSLYVGLHTGALESGNQSTNETGYTGYARIPVARDGTGWVRVGAQVSNVAAITHPVCTAAPGAAATHFSIGTDLAGAGRLLYWGTIPGGITLVVNLQPELPPGALTAGEG